MRPPFLRPAAVIAATVIVGTGALGASAARAGSNGFTKYQVAPHQLSGEPRAFAVPGTNTVYVVAPEASTMVWKSVNGGHTYGPAVSSGQGSGDSDIAVDPGNPNVVYVTDLIDSKGNFTIPVSVSTNGGAKFSLGSKLAPSTATYDRQWMASPSPNHVVVIARNIATSPTSQQAWVSTDGGHSFSKPVTIDPSVDVAGPLVVGPGGMVYFAYAQSTGGAVSGTTNLRLASSPDGLHWTTSLIATGQSPTLFPVVAADTAGNLFAAWCGTDPASNNSGVIMFSSLPKGAKTWTAPTPVSNNTKDLGGDTPVTIFPWVVAGAPGHVDVSYAIAREPVLNSPEGSDVNNPNTKWDLMVAQSLDATSAKPHWLQSVAAASFHTGSICSLGTGCLGPQSQGFGNVPGPFDRRELDFFGATLLPSGYVAVPFGMDRSITSGTVGDLIFSAIDIDVAQQTSGTAINH